MVSSSSYRARLESLPSYYSAPAGGYAPLPAAQPSATEVSAGPVLDTSGRAAAAQVLGTGDGNVARHPDSMWLSTERPARAHPAARSGTPRERLAGRTAPSQPEGQQKDGGRGVAASPSAERRWHAGRHVRPAAAGTTPSTPVSPEPASVRQPVSIPLSASPRQGVAPGMTPDASGYGFVAAAAPDLTSPYSPLPTQHRPAEGPGDSRSSVLSPPAAPQSAPGETHSATTLVPSGQAPGGGAGSITEAGGAADAGQSLHGGDDASRLPDGVPADGFYQDVDVAIVMESTYPYLKGGVSAVVHDIITGNPELTFGIIHITWDSHAPSRDLYGMPGNVAWVRVLYLSMEEHQQDFLRARPRDLRMSRRQRRTLSARLVDSLIALASEGRTEPLWEIITEGLGGGSRRYPVWAILGTQEFMEVYRERMPDLDMPMSEVFWCLRDFFSLAYAVLSESMPRAAVYHAHTTGYAALLSVNAAKEHGTSFLLTEHNLYVRDTVNTLLDRRLDYDITLNDYRTFDVTGRQRMWMAWWLEMGRLCYPYAYATTYLYPRAITEATELGGDASKAVVIPNGIVTSEFDASYAARMRAVQAIRQEGADNHLWKLVYIARVVPIKGLVDMIESVRTMVDRGLRIHLDVCGPTEHHPSYYEKCLNRIVELGLESVITIRGTIKVRQHLPDFDLFVLPSYNEGLPVVSLETMGAGIPTVSTDVGAVRSVVADEIVAEDGTVWGPCGTIIEPGDPVLMADKVQEIIQDVDLYQQLCLAARGRVEAAYNLDKVNAAYNRVYRQGGAGRTGRKGARA
ncbi:DUF3492 domain-containing protein [Actinomyces lilanjuaniae]|uniref:DUF3492 domain-containing protein n=1 Tax=Actinomyces lilanjuaniae TaxID=2321394 RepID=A0ABM6Z5W1_9ACTO|nr:DUF3492 domain-containing protein [Actinomyces lilanjuaniae]